MFAADAMESTSALLIVLSCSVLPVTAAPGRQAAPTAAGAVTEIALERQCFGCENAQGVTLRQDGSATKVRFGNARLRIPETITKGAIDRAEFERLANLLQSEGFFDLKEAYRDPAVRDGEWVTIRAEHGGGAKAVLNSNQAGPANLARIQKAIEELAERIAWTPVDR